MVLYFLTDFHYFNFHPWVLIIFYGVVLTSISGASIIQWHNYWQAKKCWYDDYSNISQAHQGEKQCVSIKDKPNPSFLTVSFCSFTVCLIARQDLFNFRYLFWFFLQDVISLVEGNSISRHLISLGAWIPGPISGAFRVVVYNMECFSWQPSHALHAMAEILES